MSESVIPVGWVVFQRIVEACLHGRDLHTECWLAENHSCPTSHINNGDTE